MLDRSSKGGLGGPELSECSEGVELAASEAAKSVPTVGTHRFTLSVSVSFIFIFYEFGKIKRR